MGLSCFYHDSSVGLVEDGKVVFAVQEERFSRIKQDARFPRKSLRRLIKDFELDIDSIDAFVFYEKPLLKFDRIVESFVSVAPKGLRMFSSAMIAWSREKLFTRHNMANEIMKAFEIKRNKRSIRKMILGKVFFSEHHLSHASSAYYPSPFDRALILTIDGVGEWATTTVSIGQEFQIERIKQIDFPNSLGFLYSAFTQYCGFKVNSGEYKLMGLAPYGVPRFAAVIEQELIDIALDGSYSINQNFFSYVQRPSMINRKFEKLFGLPARKAESDITQHYMDIAASIQKVIEKVILKMVKSLRNEYQINNFCLAGGVALNCVANGAIVRELGPINLYIQPASGDAGGSIGAALAFYYATQSLGELRKKDLQIMKDAFLGTSYTRDEILEILTKENIQFLELEPVQIDELVVSELISGHAVGWFQGKMEFGPRSLGNRSILADPRLSETQQSLNMKTKFRESFRPFAPSVLSEEAKKWFKIDCESPYMLLVADLDSSKRLVGAEEEVLRAKGLAKLAVQRSVVPAITHVDFSARLHTVEKESNERFHALLQHFYRKTGVPMLVNTSFNVRGEPIVESPIDAIRCFFATNIELLIIRNFVIEKNRQSVRDATNYISRYELD